MKAQLLAFLKGLPPLVYVVVGVLTFAGGLLSLNNYKQRQIGALNAEISQMEHDNWMLRMAQDSLAGVYRIDTVRLTRLKVRTDTLTNTVEQWKHDTLKVVEYVKQADTTIKACTATLSLCEQREKVASEGWANARSEIAKIRASYPSTSQKWLWMLAGAAGGTVVGYVAHP